MTTLLNAYPMDLQSCAALASACSLLRKDIRDPRGMAPRVTTIANAIARMFQSECFTAEQIVEETQSYSWRQHLRVSPEHGMPYVIEEACLFWPIYYDAFQAVSDTTAEERAAAEEIRSTLATLLVQSEAQKMLGSRYEMRRFVELMRGREVPDLEVPRVGPLPPVDTAHAACGKDLAQ